MDLLAYTAEGEDDDGATILDMPVLAMSYFGQPPPFGTYEVPCATTSWIDRELNPLLATPIGIGEGESDLSILVPPQYIRGTVLDVDGYGVARVVICVDRATGRRLGITTSEPDGNFVMRPNSRDPCLLIAVPQAGEQLNAVVLDNILPEPI
jgi:hypothetical protein